MAETISYKYRAWTAAVVVLAVTILLPHSQADAQSPPEDKLYHYRAVVTDVYDGDTITVDLDLGFHVWLRGEKIRLSDIDAPEVKGTTKAEGEAAADFLRNLVLNKSVIIQTTKASDGSDAKGKFGRYLGVIWLDGVNVNELLVSKGHAVRREY